mgnify:CR=1 FL=1
MPEQPWHDEQYVEVDAPPEAVYRYLADFSSRLDWADTVLDVEWPHGGFVVGAEFTTAGPAAADHRRLRITALQAPLRIAWDAEGGPGVEHWEFLLLPASRGRTTLARRVTLDPAGTVRWLLRQRRHAARLAEENRTGLDRLKSSIEAAVRLQA